MKVQKIEQSGSITTLESRGSIEGLPGTSEITLAGLKKVIPGREDINTGVFECSAGTYNRMVKQAEIMHILSGHGSFTPAGEATVTFKPGDSLFFAENTEGTWVIESQMRKIYATF